MDRIKNLTSDLTTEQFQEMLIWFASNMFPVTAAGIKRWRSQQNIPKDESAFIEEHKHSRKE